jgi:acyl homoserine lactone synthase
MNTLPLDAAYAKELPILSALRTCAGWQMTIETCVPLNLPYNDSRDEGAGMTTIATGDSEQLSVHVMSLMHEYRHSVFVKRLGWSLPLPEGVERDEYDTPEAKYLISRDASERVTACARLLPTTNAYMLPELFPQLLGDCATPRDSGIWELSRFATTVRKTREGRVLGLSRPTLEFLDAVFEFARRNGVSRLILVTSIGIERLMLRAGLLVHRVAPPAMIDGNPCVSVFIDVPDMEADAEECASLQCQMEQQCA